jgi:nitroreductase
MITGALGLSAEDTRAVLAEAGLAPSVHNSQPWRFRIEAHRIELLADTARRLPITDPDDRELRLACGAALFNIRLGLLHRGVDPQVAIHPEPQGNGIAVIRSGGPTRIGAEDEALYRAIRHRRTNRRPFLDQPVAASERHALVRAAEAEHCWLKVIGDRHSQADLPRLLLAAHRTQLGNPRWVEEFTEWISRSPADREGVTLASSGPVPEPQDIWVLRDFGRGHAPVRRPGKDFESEPLIAVVTSYFDDPFAQVQAGQALQRVLLSATTLGLSASFLSQLVEVAEARTEVRRLLGGGLFPQAVLRIGYGSPVPPVPRRAVEDCLLGEPEADHGSDRVSERAP